MASTVDQITQAIQVGELQVFGFAMPRLAPDWSPQNASGVTFTVDDASMTITASQNWAAPLDMGFQVIDPDHAAPMPVTLVKPDGSIEHDAGVLLTRVVHTKSTGGKKFVIVDAGMNDLMRPSLYEAYHEVRPVFRSHRKEVIADLVGPVCETADCFAQHRRLPIAEAGDLLAIATVGAYGFVLSSNYNSRPRPAEVLVEGRRWRIVRRRETLRDLVRGEPLK